MQLRYKNIKHPIKITERRARHVEPHLHSPLEVVYVTQGTLELGMGTELYHMEKGDVGFIFPDVIHHYQVFDGEGSRACYIQIVPSSIAVFYEILQSYAPRNPIVREEQLTGEVKQVIRALMHTSIEESVVVEAYMQILLAKCIPLFELVDKSQVGSTDLVYRVVSYISAHFKETVSLNLVAADLGVSKYVLSRVFSGVFHRNFSQYLNDIRMNYAISCLEMSQDTILEIGMESGFDSQRTFNRAFKERFHMTPSEYRNQYRKKEKDMKDVEKGDSHDEQDSV